LDKNYSVRDSVAKKQLIKFKFETIEPKLHHTLLEDTEADKCENLRNFDQFKDRKSDFSMDIYSTKMPDHVNPELQARANRLEREIGRGRDEEIILMDDCEKRRERQIASSEEKMFATALKDDQSANYKSGFIGEAEK